MLFGASVYVGSQVGSFLDHMRCPGLGGADPASGRQILRTHRGVKEGPPIPRNGQFYPAAKTH